MWTHHPLVAALAWADPLRWLPISRYSPVAESATPIPGGSLLSSLNSRRRHWCSPSYDAISWACMFKAKPFPDRMNSVRDRQRAGRLRMFNYLGRHTAMNVFCKELTSLIAFVASSAVFGSAGGMRTNFHMYEGGKRFDERGISWDGCSELRTRQICIAGTSLPMRFWPIALYNGKTGWF